MYRQYLGPLFPLDHEIEKTFRARRRLAITSLRRSPHQTIEPTNNIPSTSTTITPNQSPPNSPNSTHTPPNSPISPQANNHFIDMADQPMGYYNRPDPNRACSAIYYGAIAPNTFELRHHVTSFIQQDIFHGMKNEDANEHLVMFKEKVGTIKHNGITEEQLQLMLFPFSLKDNARKWLNSHEPRTFTTWEALSKAFINKFYPPSKTAKIRHDIQTFKQRNLETLSEAWERFRDLLVSCPHHGIPKWMTTQIFFQTLEPRFRDMIVAASGGNFDKMNNAEITEMIQNISEMENSYGGRENDFKGEGSSKPDYETRAKVEELTKRLDKMSMEKSHGQVHQIQERRPSHSKVYYAQEPRSPPRSPSRFYSKQPSCDTCGGHGHTYDVCPSYLQDDQYRQQECYSLQGHQPPKQFSYQHQDTFYRAFPNQDSRLSYEGQPLDPKYQAPQFLPPPKPDHPRNYDQNYGQNSDFRRPPHHNNRSYVPPHQRDQRNNNQNQQNNPPYQAQNQPPLSIEAQNPNSSIEQMLKNMDNRAMQREAQVDQQFKLIRSEISNVQSHQKSVDSYMANQAVNNPSRGSNSLPGQPSNPKDGPHHQQVHAILLRDGKELGKPHENLDSDLKRMREMKEKVVEQPRYKEPSILEEIIIEDLEPSEKEEVTGEVEVTKPPPKVTKTYTPPLPFPNRAKTVSKEKKFAKFVEMLKKLEVSLPFTEVLTQMPLYAKFLKEVLTKKRSIGDDGLVSLTGECSAVLLNPMPKKLQDPGSFSIPCVVGNVPIEKALCDLGASVSILPLPIARRLGLEDMIPTSMTLQLADRSVKHPMGILEDIPVKVGSVYIPSDFVVLDIPENRQTPIILGRPFMATGGVIIDVKKGHLSFNVGGNMINFSLMEAMSKPMHENVHSVDVLNDNEDDVWLEFVAKKRSKEDEIDLLINEEIELFLNSSSPIDLSFFDNVPWLDDFSSDLESQVDAIEEAIKGIGLERFPNGHEKYEMKGFLPPQATCLEPPLTYHHDPLERVGIYTLLTSPTHYDKPPDIEKGCEKLSCELCYVEPLTPTWWQNEGGDEELTKLRFWVLIFYVFGLLASYLCLFASFAQEFDKLLRALSNYEVKSKKG